MLFVVRLAVFLTTLIAATMVISGPPRVPEPIGSTLAYVTEHRDDFDLLFVGSSRMMRGIIPAEFDARLAERGLAISSFNFSAIGMREHEANVYLRQILEAQPARLRWTLVETSDWTPSMLRPNRFSARSIAWHEPRESWLVMRDSLALDQPIEIRWDDFSTHLLHLLARSGGLGRGWDRWRAVFRGGEPAKSPAAGRVQHRGFVPYTQFDHEHGATAEHRRQYLESPHRITEPAGIAAAPEAVIAAALERQSAEIQAFGTEAIAVAMPRLKPFERPTIPPQTSSAVRSLAFDDPAAYPEFYRVENRFDAEHLNTAGARRFSRLLADQFADRFVEN